jgi:hypothetical protein
VWAITKRKKGERKAERHHKTEAKEKRSKHFQTLAPIRRGGSEDVITRLAKGPWHLFLGSGYPSARN